MRDFIFLLIQPSVVLLIIVLSKTLESYYSKRVSEAQGNDVHGKKCTYDKLRWICDGSFQSY